MGWSIDLTIVKFYEVNQAQQMGKQLIRFEIVIW